MKFHATTTLHHQQGSGVQQFFHGDRTGDAQLVYNVRPVEPRGGDTEAILSLVGLAGVAVYEISSYILRYPAIF